VYESLPQPQNKEVLQPACLIQQCPGFRQIERQFVSQIDVTRRAFRYHRGQKAGQRLALTVYESLPQPQNKEVLQLVAQQWRQVGQPA
jgi:hypothetical protein